MKDAAHHMSIGKCENVRNRRDETEWLSMAAENGVTPDRFESYTLTSNKDLFPFFVKRNITLKIIWPLRVKTEL